MRVQHASITSAVALFVVLTAAFWGYLYMQEHLAPSDKRAAAEAEQRPAMGKMLFRKSPRAIYPRAHLQAPTRFFARAY